jgi:hypothetical protein
MDTDMKFTYPDPVACLAQCDSSAKASYTGTDDDYFKRHIFT